MSSNEYMCIHRHTIESHPSCFAKGLILHADDESGAKKVRQELTPTKYRRVNIAHKPWYEHPEYRVGYFDIEASNLKANVGYMISYAIKDKASDDVIYREIKQEDVYNRTFDKELIKQCLKDLSQFKIWVTYYGTGYDIPFIRTRAEYWYQKERKEREEKLQKKTVKKLKKELQEFLPEDRRVPSRLKKQEIIDAILDRDEELMEWAFPAYGSHYNFDLYYIVRAKYSLTRKSLGLVTEFFGIEGKTHLKPHEWTLAGLAYPEIMEKIKEHNIEDVKILQRLHDIINPYKKWTRKSI